MIDAGKLRIGNKNTNWKGGIAHYESIHNWVRKNKIKPDVCDICHKIADKNGNIKLELSNIRNHKYTDKPEDYQYVHISCHRKYDAKRRKELKEKETKSIF